MSKKEDLKTLNDFGKSWLKRNIDNQAECNELENKIFELIFQIYKKAKKIDDLSTFFLKYWKKFETSDMPLSEYVHSRLNYSKRLDDFKDAGGHTKKVEADEELNYGEVISTDKSGKKTIAVYNTSLDLPVTNSGDNDGMKLLDTQSDNSDHYNDFFEREHFDETVLHAINIMLDIESHLSGKSKNEKSILYKTMFHTEAVSSLCHNGIITEDYPHERELIETLKLTFLDYYTLEECRAIKNIRQSPLKRLFEISEEDPEDKSEAKLPLKQGVIKTYLKKHEGMEVSDGAISQQRKKYYEFTKEFIPYER